MYSFLQSCGSVHCLNGFREPRGHHKIIQTFGPEGKVAPWANRKRYLNCAINWIWPNSNSWHVRAFHNVHNWQKCVPKARNPSTRSGRWVNTLNFYILNRQSRGYSSFSLMRNAERCLHLTPVTWRLKVWKHPTVGENVKDQIAMHRRRGSTNRWDGIDV